jgi:hypothetical protein
LKKLTPLREEKIMLFVRLIPVPGSFLLLLPLLKKF